MLNTNTVFVIGAGSSCELGLPTGDKLRLSLMRILERDGDNSIFTNPTLNQIIHGKLASYTGSEWGLKFEEYARAAERIKKALPMAQSIDNLIHAHRTDSNVIDIGKIAIAIAIIAEEHESYIKSELGNVSQLVEPARFDDERFLSSWYLPLMRLIVSGETKENIRRIFANTSFIVFNYDRCLEHFLINAVRSYFNISPDEAADIVNEVVIIHPYGQVGFLPWQASPIDSPKCQFGHGHTDISAISRGIYTFTESIDEGITASCKRLIESAETLVMMGYGFLPRNTDLLSCESPSNVSRVFATACGIGETDLNIVKSEISHILGKTIDRFSPFVERSTCRTLMDNNWMRLSIKRGQR